MNELAPRDIGLLLFAFTCASIVLLTVAHLIVGWVRHGADALPKPDPRCDRADPRGKIR